MEIRFLRFKLVKVTRDHLELIRGWRNTEEVRGFMIFQEYITSEMQSAWFDSIQNETNFFFVIYEADNPVGLIDIKHINWAENSADSGIFIAPLSSRNGDISCFSSVMSATFMTQVLGIRKLYGKVLASNKAAIAFNLTNGFTVVGREADVVYMCIPDTHVVFPEVIGQKIKLCRLYKEPDTSPIQLLITKADIESDPATRWLVEQRVLPHYRDFVPGLPLTIL